jgi:hypothetical protein
MDLLPTDAASAPTRWMVVFKRRSDLWWVNLFVPGRFKHVCAFGFVPACDCWVFYDVGFERTSINLARGRAARYLMLDWARDAEVLAMPKLQNAPVLYNSYTFICTTAIAALIGIPGALLPDRLHAQCLRHGAEIVAWEVQEPAREPEPSAARLPAQPLDQSSPA